jgi:hypothetical protein
MSRYVNRFKTILSSSTTTVVIVGASYEAPQGDSRFANLAGRIDQRVTPIAGIATHDPARSSQAPSIYNLLFDAF